MLFVNVEQDDHDDVEREKRGGWRLSPQPRAIRRRGLVWRAKVAHPAAAAAPRSSSCQRVKSDASKTYYTIYCSMYVLRLHNVATVRRRRADV